MIDTILELKRRCSFAEQMGHAYDFSPQDVSCIRLIADHPGSSVHELSELLGISISRASRIVSRLNRRGFIRSESDPNDRRSLQNFLTDEGVVCHYDITRERELCEKRLADKLTDEQRGSIERALKLLLEIM